MSDGNLFRIMGSNFFGGTGIGSSLDEPTILGDPRYLNVWFPGDWTYKQAEEWRELHGMAREQNDNSQPPLIKPKSGLIV